MPSHATPASEPPAEVSCTSSSDLRHVVRDVERHVATDGWDQPTRLFALAEVGALPGPRPVRGTTSRWVALEQPSLPVHDDPLRLLARLEWPDDVAGAVLALETVLAGAGSQLPEEPVAAREAAARDPRRHEARLAVAVLADGGAAAALRWRSHDRDADVSIAGGELVPALTEALRATFGRSS